MRVQSGAASATSFTPGSHTDESIWAAPNAPQPRATGAAPSGWNPSSEPTGASMTGIRSLRPNTVVDASILQTFCSTRGRNAIESSAMRFRRSVVSVSVPPTM
jgi:hypothetical protein